MLRHCLDNGTSVVQATQIQSIWESDQQLMGEAVKRTFSSRARNEVIPVDL